MNRRILLTAIATTLLTIVIAILINISTISPSSNASNATYAVLIGSVIITLILSFQQVFDFTKTYPSALTRRLAEWVSYKKRTSQTPNNDKELSPITPTITTHAYFTDELTVSDEIKFEVKSVVREVEQAQETIAQNVELELSKEVSAEIDEVLNTARVNSRAALLLLSSNIEAQLRLLLQEAGLQSETNYALSRRAVDDAMKAGLISQETVSSFRDFMAVRNKVAHGAGFDVDEPTILSLVSIGIELLKILSSKKRDKPHTSNVRDVL